LICEWLWGGLKKPKFYQLILNLYFVEKGTKNAKECKIIHDQHKIEIYLYLDTNIINY